MTTVYQVQEPGGPITRLHLPATAWGNTVRERLVHLGWIVQVTDQVPCPDTRDAEELARRDAILAWAAPLTTAAKTVYKHSNLTQWSEHRSQSDRVLQGQASQGEPVVRR